MPAARGERRKAAVWPTSAAVSSRASGELARVYSIIRWISPMALAAREASGPAEMVLTRTPNRRPASKASVRVSDSSAAPGRPPPAVPGNAPLAGHVGERDEGASPSRAHQGSELPHQRDVAVRAHADRFEVAPAAGIEQGVPDFGPVGEAVHHDVQAAGPEVLAEPRRHARDGEIAPVLVPLVFAELGGGVLPGGA